MSRSKNSRKGSKGRNAGRDLWKPGKMSGKSHSPDNKRIDRRVARHKGKKEE